MCSTIRIMQRRGSDYGCPLNPAFGTLRDIQCAVNSIAGFDIIDNVCSCSQLVLLPAYPRYV